MPSPLPQAETQFFDNSGNPLAGGKVYTYILGTTTPKTTWQDALGQISNANPITLDSNGRAIIYGVGQYRTMVYDTLGNLIIDQATQIPEPWDLTGFSYLTDSGSTNALTVNLGVKPQSLSNLTGLTIWIEVGNTNTGGATLNVGFGGTAVQQGAAALSGGELVAGCLYPFTFTGTVWKIPSSPASAITLVQLQNDSITPTFKGLTSSAPSTLEGNGSGDTVTVSDTGNASGAQIKIIGNGSTTPTKIIRVKSGILEILNDSGTVVASIDDSGNAIFAGTVTGSGTPV